MELLGPLLGPLGPVELLGVMLGPVELLGVMLGPVEPLEPLLGPLGEMQGGAL